MSKLTIFNIEFEDWGCEDEMGWTDRISTAEDSEDPAIHYIIGFAFETGPQAWATYFTYNLINVIELNHQDSISKLINSLPRDNPEQVKNVIDEYLVRLSNLSLFK